MLVDSRNIMRGQFSLKHPIKYGFSYDTKRFYLIFMLDAESAHGQKNELTCEQVMQNSPTGSFSPFFSCINLDGKRSGLVFWFKCKYVTKYWLTTWPKDFRWQSSWKKNHLHNNTVSSRWQTIINDAFM